MNVLIIDDEKNLTKSLSFALKQADIGCCIAHNGHDGLSLLNSESPDAVLLDVRLVNESGLDLLPVILDENPDVPVIMMSAYGDTKDVVQAIKEGAVDYLIKPFDVDELLLLLKEHVARKRLRQEVNYFREKNHSDDGLIGASLAMSELRRNIDCVAESNVKTILLLGDTGVGKTLIAKEIHKKTLGKDAPFVEINCAALPADLIEVELFGAEKGAYTGADSKRIGLVEVANNGTLFLDEIGELSLPLQAKLLSLLESWSFRPVGGVREKKADIRVILATNRDLSQAVEEADFRRDLYFRINTMPISIPDLMSRDDDVMLLVHHFIHFYAKREGVNPIVIDKKMMTIFKSYLWPGNVRELRNLIERLTILYSGKLIKAAYLPPEMVVKAPSIITEHTSKDATFHDNLLSNERELILNALEECRWRKGLAAQKLGISRHALKRRIQKLELE